MGTYQPFSFQMITLISFISLLFVNFTLGSNDFYVMSNQTSTTNCGNSTFPCGTISSGIFAACNYYESTGSTNITVWVYSGNYIETDVSTIDCPLTVRSFDGSSTTTIKPINRTAPNAFDVNNPGGSVSITGFTISSSEVNESIFSFFRTGDVYIEDIVIIGGNITSCIDSNFGDSLSISSFSMNSLTVSQYITVSNVNNITLNDICLSGNIQVRNTLKSLFDFSGYDAFTMRDSNFTGIMGFYRFLACQSDDETGITILDNIYIFQIKGHEIFATLSSLIRTNGFLYMSNCQIANIQGFQDLLNHKGGVEIYNNNFVAIENVDSIFSIRHDYSLQNGSIDFRDTNISMVYPNDSIFDIFASDIIHFGNMSIQEIMTNSLMLISNTEVFGYIIIEDSSFSSCYVNFGIYTYDVIYYNLTISNTNFETFELTLVDEAILPVVFYFNAVSKPQLLDVKMNSCNFNNINISFLYGTFSSVTMEACTISNSSSDIDFIDILYGDITITNSYVSGITSKSFLYCESSVIDFTSVDFFGNSFGDAAIYIQSGDNLKKSYFRDSTITNNMVINNAFVDVNRAIIEISNINSTNNTASLGGLLSCSYLSEVRIINSTVQENNALYGGALYTFSTCRIEVEECLFDRCTAASDGGAIWFSGISDGYIRNSTFTYNTAQNYGGGILLQGDASFELSNNRMEGNSAILGGCLYTGDNAIAIVSNTVFDGCSSKTSGGAIAAGSYSAPSFDNCIIQNCIADSTGSGAVLQAFAAPVFNNTIFSNNYSPNEGGAIYTEDKSSSRLFNVSFINNCAQSSGGALAMTINSTANIIGCVFDNNTSGSKGGAIAIMNQACPTIQDSIIQNNSANSGGALYVTDDGAPVFSNCFIHHNTANSRGGAIYTSSAANCSFTHCTISDNTAITGTGGGILIQDFVITYLRSVIFTNNFATYGGAIYGISTFSTDASDCFFRNNSATYSGGALILGENSYSIFQTCYFTNNTASTGGGIETQENSFTIFNDCIVSDNIASENGGGLALSDSSTLTSNRSIFSHNQAIQGAGVYISENGNFIDTNSTFLANIAQETGGGMKFAGGSIYLRGVNFEGNTATIGGGIFINYGENIPLLSNCIFSQNYATSGGGMALLIDDHVTLSNITTNDDNYSDYSFIDLIFLENNAINGGGLFIDSPNPNIPIFGPTCTFTNNTANMFGGAILFGDFNIPSVIMYNGTFSGNIGNYGACNVAFSKIDNTSDANNYCENCNYGDDTYPPDSYQNEYGFASAPSHLSTASCPGTVTFDALTFSVSVYLKDEFDTIVHGVFLEQFPNFVNLVGNSINVFLQTSNHTLPILESGQTIFNDLSLCGPNNSTIILNFSPTIDYSNLYTIEKTQCSISLFGCDAGYELKQSDNCGTCGTCDSICVETTDNSLLTLILVSVIIGLCVILCIIAGIFSGWRYMIKRKRDRLAALEIPDFNERPPLTLEEILNDPTIPRLDWHEIVIGDTIGKGASGLVSRGKWTKSGKSKDIALKELILGIEFGIEIFEEFLVEIKYMSALVNPHIVQFLGICVSPDHSKLYLVTELMHYGSVRDLLDKKGSNLNYAMRIQIAKDAAKGVAYLHSKKLIHRDLKTQNLLVNNVWSCKVADFGISRVKPDETRAMTCIGTPVYMAPEVLSKNKYSEKADVFSFGIVLAEIFNGNRPYSEPEYKDLNQAQLMYQILEKGVRPNIENLSISLQQLIRDCWNEDPRMRPSFAELVVRLRRLKGEITEEANVPANDSLPSLVGYRNNDSRTNSSEFNLTYPPGGFLTENDPLIQ